VNGTLVTALIDTGCSRSIISHELGRPSNKSKQTVIMMNGNSVDCSETNADLEVEGVKFNQICLLSDTLPGYKMLLGMDIIVKLGGITVSKGKVKFATSSACTASVTSIEDQDYSIKFEAGKWVVKWKWNENGSDARICESEELSDAEVKSQGPILRNRISQYPPKESSVEAFEEEVEQWITDGWLRPYEGPYDGIVPLMAVVQRNKAKVRPVLDYREVNGFISSHTAESVVCHETLRKWRMMGSNLSIIDLRKAYLQLHIHPDLWRFQVVKYKGKTYCMTRLGFGLNVAPKVMSAVLNKVLSSDPDIADATDSYVDDIIVNNDKVSNESVLKLLQEFGLEAKEPESLDGGRALGLRVTKRGGVLEWSRDNQVDDLKPNATRRQIFSWCGQLTGHLPVANWLRPACSFLKRLCSEGQWDDEVSDRAMLVAKDIEARFQAKDPAGGTWEVSRLGSGTLWCDASSLALGVCLEIEGQVVEDGSWLRKPNDASHINLAELESVVKGVNLALAWKLKEIELKVDSASVHAWIRSIVTGDRRIRTKGLGEALVRRRLSILTDIINEYDIRLSVTLIPSHCNKADVLTRVPQQWLRKAECFAAQTNAVTREEIREIHRQHHFGVDRTQFFVQQHHPDRTVLRSDVEKVVKSCHQCLRIDPTPETVQHGQLDVEETWERLACDTTSYKGQKYLSLVDSGPSRFTIWREIQEETAEEIAAHLEQIFSEHGPPREILFDNGASFRSQKVAAVLRKWEVDPIYRCAYRPCGNAIVERNHRTIKRMAARSEGSIQDMIWHYNASPREDTDETSRPCYRKYNHVWRYPKFIQAKYRIGDHAFVKPRNSRCTTKWNVGTITDIISSNKIEVDGIPRHANDLRLIPSDSESDADCATSESTEPAVDNQDLSS